MSNRFGVSIGIWEIFQDGTTHEVSLYKYGELIESWTESKNLSWDEMYAVLSRKSVERSEA